MIVGDEKKFAIEIEFDETNINEWMFGKLCYWICGIRFGEYGSGTTLRNVYYDIKKMIKNSGERRSSALINQNVYDAYFNFLITTIHKEKYHPCYELSKKEKWYKFNITPDSVSEFDGVLAFLVDGDEYSRVVVYDYDQGIFNCNVERGVVDNALFKVHEILEERFNMTQSLV